MKLKSRLWLCSRLAFAAFSLVNACSTFPNYICCSSLAPLPELLNNNKVSDFEYGDMTDIKAANATLPKSLRILCFGDSLTAGYTMVSLQSLNGMFRSLIHKVWIGTSPIRRPSPCGSRAFIIVFRRHSEGCRSLWRPGGRWQLPWSY